MRFWLICLLLVMSARPASAFLKATEVAAAKQTSVAEFKGLSFGVGLGVSFLSSGDDVIQKAEVIGDTVRVLEEKNSVPRLLLESHYFFVPTRWNRRVGVGPFFAVQSGSNEVIEAIGWGLMIGFRRTEVEVDVDETNGDENKAKVNTNSFNFGFGAVLDNKALVLREGIRENRPVSQGQGSITRETSKWGMFIASSFTF